jgi:hypothetical protein
MDHEAQQAPPTGGARRGRAIAAPVAVDPGGRLTTAAAVLALQRGAGNRAVGRILARQFTRKDFKRPNFASAVYKSATYMHNVRLRATIDPTNPELAKRNLAVPHRFPWKALRDNTLRYLNQEEDEADFKRWTNRMIKEGSDDVDRAIRRRIKVLEFKHKRLKKKYGDWDDKVERVEDRIAALKRVRERIEDSCDVALSTRKTLIATFDEYGAGNATKADVVATGAKFLQAMNNLYANVPDLGPHRGVNIPVRERLHLNVLESGDLSPFSSRMLDMTPGRVEGVATTSSDEVVTTTGKLVDLSSLDDDVQMAIGGIGEHPVNYKKVPFDFGDQ